jgi:hypothetical protein
MYATSFLLLLAIWNFGHFHRLIECIHWKEDLISTAWPREQITVGNILNQKLAMKAIRHMAHNWNKGIVARIAIDKGSSQ